MAQTVDEKPLKGIKFLKDSNPNETDEKSVEGGQDI